MYSCPSCGSNIKFNIKSQDMYCEYCNTHHSPYDFKKDNDATESEYFDSIIYTCPQCGGKIISADEEATAYCSYCGASNVLTGRLKKEKMPKYIIPFKVTKEECIEIYKSKMRENKFCPGNAKSDKCINNMKPIYMPYYLYHIRQSGRMVLKGERKTENVAETIVDTMMITGDVESEFPEIPYEASALFFDSLSNRIEPYDLSKKMRFSPAYLSGFYADVADVDPFVYENDAIEDAEQLTLERIEIDNRVSNIKVYNEDKQSCVSQQLKTECIDVETAYFPVWLFSYKHGKKISYAAINGQTGKIGADVPISIPKYLACSFAVAVVLAMLLSIFKNFSPATFLSVFSVLVIFSNNMLINEMIDTVKKEKSYKDKGLAWKRSGKVLSDDGFDMQKRSLGIGPILLFCLVSPATMMVLLYALSSLNYIIIAIGATVCFIRGNKLVDYRNKAKGFASIFISFLALVISALILYIKPKYVWMYLGGDIICFIAMIVIVVEMMRGLIMTNKRILEQLYRGGRQRG